MGIRNLFTPTAQDDEARSQSLSWANTDPVLGTSTNAGIPVTNTGAVSNYAVVYHCIRLLSETVASLPLDTYTKRNEAASLLPSPAWLAKPNTEQNSYEFMEQVLSSLLSWGNAYLVKVYSTKGVLLELWVLDPSQVVVTRDEASKKITYVIGGKPYDESVILHIKAFTLAGSLTGLSPISVGREAIAAGMATDQYASKFWSNGAHIAGILELDGEADDEWIKKTRAAWQQAYSSTKNAHKVAVLTGGAKYQSMALPQEDAQFLETRKFQVNEIATRIFNIPAHMAGDLDRATFSNIEHQAIQFVTYTLRPWLVRIEMALNELLPPSQYLKFNEKALLRGDNLSQATYLKTAVQGGLMNLDEARGKIDLPPLPNGEGQHFYMPLNLAAIDGAEQLSIQEKINAVGGLIRAGFDPAESLKVVGLPDIEHSGSLPLTLYSATTYDEAPAQAEAQTLAKQKQAQEAPKDQAA